MNLLVILPTYNEKQNIESLVSELLYLKMNLDVLVVDDNSPDGTAEKVRQIKDPQVHLLLRTQGKDGRGGAVRAGFEWALKSNKSYDLIFEMDSDKSHKPSEISQAISLMQDSLQSEVPAMVIASRYMKNSQITGWTAYRKFFSRLANGWARFLLTIPISDFTNGFRGYNKAALKVLLAQPPLNKGFIYLSECLAIIHSRHGKIFEFSSHWENRIHGHSNAGFKEIYDAFIGILRVAIQAKRNFKA